jgi:hypothetical protein
MSDNPGKKQCNKFFYIGKIEAGSRVYIRENLEQGGMENLRKKLAESILTAMKGLDGKGEVIISLACEACKRDETLLGVVVDAERYEKTLKSGSKKSFKSENIEDLMRELAQDAASKAIRSASAPTIVLVSIESLADLLR